jgi:hypothetical protein
MTDPRPAPLVPPEVDLRDFPRMGLDVARLKGSELVVNETPEVCWAALMLWCAAWHEVPAGSVPNNERWLADKAGYLSRGQIDLSWGQIRPGVMRGFIECSDGRLYHKVTCEVALDAWSSKLRQRWISECARVRKHNQRHGTSVTTLDFDDWLRAGCPIGAALPVRSDDTQQSQGQVTGGHAAVPRETASKRREEKGILSISPTTVGETRESASPPAPPPPEGSTEAPAASTPARKRAAAAPALPCPADVPEDVWAAWLELRRKKRAPVSDVVLQQARKEAGLAKLSLEQFLRVWCFRGSQGLHADWITPQDRQRFGSTPASDRVGRQLRTAALMVNPPEAPGARKPAEPVQEVIDVTPQRIA